MVIFNIMLGILAWNMFMSIYYYKNKIKSNRLYCGLIGFSGKGEFDPLKIKTLFIWNSLERHSTDSTGLYTPEQDVIKTNDPAQIFINKVDFKPSTTLIGHVRASTVGNNTKENAHPFKRGSMILVHNGTLKNHWGLLKKYDLPYNDYNVDSDVICGIIDKSKNFDVLKEINGAAALIIADKINPDVLFVFRNTERPLFRGTINGDMYISSIANSLTLIGCSNINEFKENILYKINKGVIEKRQKIKSDPYTVYTYNQIQISNSFNIKDFNLTGYWIQANSNYFHNNFYINSVTNDSWYYVKSHNIASDYEIQIIDDEQKTKSISKYLFNWKEADVEQGDYIVMMTTLHQGDNKKTHLCNEGDIAIITNFDKEDNTYSIKFGNDSKDIWSNIPSKWFRKSTKLETDKYLNKNSNTQCELILNTDVNDKDIIDPINNTEFEELKVDLPIVMLEQFISSIETNAGDRLKIKEIVDDFQNNVYQYIL